MSNTRRPRLRLVLFALLLTAIATSSAAAAPASGGTTITRQDVTGDLVVCDSQALTVTAGTFTIVVHETLTPSGAYHLTVAGNAQGVKAVAANGATYQLPGGFWIAVNVTPGASTETQIDVLNVIGQGSAPSFAVRGVVHTTIDANGNVTAFVDRFTATGSCSVPPMG